jgi:hypothetical protein
MISCSDFRHAMSHASEDSNSEDVLSAHLADCADCQRWFAPVEAELRRETQELISQRGRSVEVAGSARKALACDAGARHLHRKWNPVASSMDVRDARSTDAGNGRASTDSMVRRVREDSAESETMVTPSQSRAIGREDRVGFQGLVTTVVLWLRQHPLVGGLISVPVAALLVILSRKPTCDASFIVQNGITGEMFAGQCSVGIDDLSRFADTKSIESPVPGLYFVSDGEVLAGYVHGGGREGRDQPAVQVSPDAYATIVNRTGQDLRVCTGQNESDCFFLRSSTTRSLGAWPKTWFRTRRSREERLQATATLPLNLVYTPHHSGERITLPQNDAGFPHDWEAALALHRPGKYRVTIEDGGVSMPFSLASRSSNAVCRVCGAGTTCIEVSGDLTMCADSPELKALAPP